MLTSIIASTSTRLAIAAAVAITALSVGGSVSSSHQHLVTADGTSSSAPVSTNGGNKGVFGWD